MLRVILEIPDLKVTESKSQYTIVNLKGKLPLYHIDRTIRELNSPFDDKSHIIYVNGEYRGDNPIGNLLHDFSKRKVLIPYISQSFSQNRIVNLGLL